MTNRHTRTRWDSPQFTRRQTDAARPAHRAGLFFAVFAVAMMVAAYFDAHTQTAIAATLLQAGFLIPVVPKSDAELLAKSKPTRKMVTRSPYFDTQAIVSG